MTTKHAPTDVSIHELLAGRWSPRAFSNEPVSREHLHSVLEAARWAPSSFNAQPWRFLVFDRSTDEASFKRAFATLVPFNQGWNGSVPVLIAVTTQTLTSKGEVNRCAPYDAGAAAMALVLQAHALGLAAHQMAGVDINAFRSAFAIPDDVEVIAMISLGHYGDAAKLDPALRDREKAGRTRSPLGEIAFAGAWKKPFVAA
ncbi:MULTISPECIES: nitroreductase family protein [Paraburkholderia]|uniref:nitroreductase family protein n=1 Tax=Paraburkholderia TaxID=1822464 RepID=UPI002258649A|nr:MULTISPECIES: nitroreductase family protein [Paraburkholderia]MCX4165825.1 nitroreductase family protein [Paraburkholderia megapolitana]MDN7161316.1 nitroreductase family protein [Paraburkholderia sp. CHISQ3]MDQ6498363.1 nitroreductase family protein [Paraburkholderia megapolitana]